MTEADWMACTDPWVMLRRIRDYTPFNERKMRLFVVACSRLVWDRMRNETMRNAIETAERFADGFASADDLNGASGEVYRLSFGGGMSIFERAASMGLDFEDYASVHGLARCATVTHVGLGKLLELMGWRDGARLTEAAQPSVLRDIFGLRCFHPLPMVEGSWLTWNDGTIPNLAKRIYDERVYDRLPILEDAGCTDAEILNHCRQPGVHVRGCWVVDLLLGKS